MERRDQAYTIREQAALNEKDRPVLDLPTNKDEETYPSKIANFSKCLPHNELGEVDANAYAALLHALDSYSLADFEAVPVAGILRIASPLGGVAFGIEGPDSYAIGLNPPHSFNSLEMAAEMAELYWMTLIRDVPFTDYGTSPLVSEAIQDLSRFPGQFIRDPTTGRITPDNLFLADYPGVSDGPRVSQFLLFRYTLDGVPIEQKINTPLSVTESNGIDFLTAYDEWLVVQRGFPVGTSPGEPRIDPQLRFIRNVRDMGWNADQSSITSTYLKAGLILLGLGRDALDDNNPYKFTRAVGGLGTFDIAHLQTLLGRVATARHFNFQKWHHRRLRPETFSGRIHNHQCGAASYPIHDMLLQSPVLGKIYEYNAMVNQRRGVGDGKGTFLLPCLFGEGAVTHPSFPAGHGVAAGVGVTLLKAWFKEDFVLPDSVTVKPNRDGTNLEPYEAGRDGPPLTIRGELNKLAYNITWGRNMSGVHFRDDGIAGNRLGEELAIRLLTEARATYAEPFSGFSLTKFDGTQITV